jgi:hypothetical protein
MYPSAVQQITVDYQIVKDRLGAKRSEAPTRGRL